MNRLSPKLEDIHTCLKDAPLREAACQMRDALLDLDIGDCSAGLPDGEALLYGQLTALEIETQVKAAIDYAAREGAALVLAILGHGFIPGRDSTLYLMAWDSVEDVRHKAVDIGRLLVEAADNPAVDGVIGIIDTCNAAGAQPQSSGLVTGSRGGQTRLSLLMASAVGQEAYDLSMSRELSGLLRAGLPDAGPKLSLYDVLTYLRTVMRKQDLISTAYDGDQSSGFLWLAHNRQKMVGALPLGSDGAAQLLEALKDLCPGKTFAETWSADRLRDLCDDLDSMSSSPELTRVRRLIDNLVVAQKTISFLRSVMAAAVSTQGLRRALMALNNAPKGVLMNPARGAIISEADAVEFVA